MDQPLDLSLSASAKQTLRMARLNASQERTPTKLPTNAVSPAVLIPRQILGCSPYSANRQSDVSSTLYIATGTDESTSTCPPRLPEGGLLQSALLRPIVPLNLTSSSCEQHSNSSSGVVSVSSNDETAKTNENHNKFVTVIAKPLINHDTSNRMSYPREFKLLVIEYYYQHGQNKYRTCKQYGITKSMLNGWLAKIDKIRESRPGSLKSGRSGRRPQFPVIEKQLYEMYKQHVAGGNKVGNKWIRDTARQLASKQCSSEQLSGMCQFSERWLSNFKKRFGINLNREWSSGSAHGDTSSISSRASAGIPHSPMEVTNSDALTAHSSSSTVITATSELSIECGQADLDECAKSAPTTSSSSYPISDTSRCSSPDSESDVKIDVDDSSMIQQLDKPDTKQPSLSDMNVPSPAVISTCGNNIQLDPAQTTAINTTSTLAIIDNTTANLVNQTPATFGSSFSWMPMSKQVETASTSTNNDAGDFAYDMSQSAVLAAQITAKLSKQPSIVHSVPPNYEPGRRGRKVQFPQVERVLYDRLVARQSAGHRVSNRWLQEQARAIAQQMCPQILAEATKSARCMFSEHWLHNFKKRYNVSLKQQTSASSSNKDSSSTATGLSTRAVQPSVSTLYSRPSCNATIGVMPLRPTPVKHAVTQQQPQKPQQQQLQPQQQQQQQQPASSLHMQHWLLQQAIINQAAAMPTVVDLQKRHDTERVMQLYRHLLRQPNNI